MNPHKILLKAIDLIKTGKKDIGERILYDVIKHSESSHKMRTVAYWWLAEGQNDTHLRIEYLKKALEYDPSNSELKSRLNNILASPTQQSSQNLPASQLVFLDEIENMESTRTSPFTIDESETMPSVNTPFNLQQQASGVAKAPLVVGIYQGSDNTGTGIFVSIGGIIATTRDVVGENDMVTIKFGGGRFQPASVVRTYPELDLTLMQAAVSWDQIWTTPTEPLIPNNEVLTIQSFKGTQRGLKRSTQNGIAKHWIETSIDIMQVPDAEGAAILDSKKHLVGLLTYHHNHQTHFAYGLHISYIYACVKQYELERSQMPNTDCCTSCGTVTSIQQNNGYYCNVCGATKSHKIENIYRMPSRTRKGVHINY